jgi:hypothetical protein
MLRKMLLTVATYAIVNGWLLDCLLAAMPGHVT